MAWRLFIVWIAFVSLNRSGLLADPTATKSKPAIDCQLITIQPGDLPIIFSSSHGGRSAIPGVNERTNKNATRFVTVRDENTAELTESAISEIERRTGHRPYAVIAHFERKYLDVNRAAKDAFESETSQAYYQAYHQALSDFCREVQKKWQGGLLLDIHGQKVHPDNLLRGTNNGRTTTLLRQRLGAGAIVGQHSILGMMDQAGYHVLPKLDSNDPEIKNYSGGEIVQAHGSQVASGIDAIQLEFGSSYRHPKSAAVKSGRDLAEAVEAFCLEYFPQALPRAVPSR